MLEVLRGKRRRGGLNAPLTIALIIIVAIFLLHPVSISEIMLNGWASLSMVMEHSNEGC